MEKARLIELPKILDERGNLTFIEENHHIPFEIARVVWIYDVPGGEGRRGYKCHRNDEFIVPISGSFEVELDISDIITLNRSNVGLFIPAGQWHRMINFSTNSVALILCSRPQDSNDVNYEHD